MANMDYPGPCPSCVGIDGCSTEDGKKKAVENYCKGLEMELNVWKARLYDVLAEEADATLSEQVVLLKSTMKELEAIANEMKDVCPTNMGEEEKVIAGKLEDLRVHYSNAMKVIAPGWFGG